MPEKCVVFGCSNVPNSKEGIALHPIPFYGKDDPQKRKRRKKWVDFVQLREDLAGQCRSLKLPRNRLTHNSSNTRWYFVETEHRNFHSGTYECNEKRRMILWMQSYVHARDKQAHKTRVAFVYMQEGQSLRYHSRTFSVPLSRFSSFFCSSSSNILSSS